MGFAKPIEQYLFGNLIHVFMYLKDIIRGGIVMRSIKRNNRSDSNNLHGL